MAEQAIGASSRMSWKKELAAGVPNFPLVGGGGDTTLVAAVQPGATSIDVVDATGITAGNIIRVGDDYNPEYVEVASVASNTITLHASTWINFRHESGEQVKEVTPGGFTRMDKAVSADEISPIAKIISQAITSQRGTPKSRPGDVEVSFNLVFELAIEQSGVFFRYALGKDYSVVGTALGGGASDSTDGAIAAGATSFSLEDDTGFSAGQVIPN